ncbi:hypothetical protein ACFYXF_24040 [Streptomyces sp. NPDC002680]|uniref:hypothetical protein n=1 Tax=Streptomyces sp. NPDC002680 TaxID=3364659 RepID=UPI0036C7A89F
MSPRRITALGERVADTFAEPASTSNELGLRVLPVGGPANTAVQPLPRGAAAEPPLLKCWRGWMVPAGA